MFATKEECEKYVLDIHNLYNSFLEDVCAIPVLAGKKTEGEKFAGAVDTYTREVFSQDGQCIQTGTSHFLGQNFSKMFDVKFQDKQNNFSYPYYMSAGITTRLIGDIIVVHGDDKGLVLPFDLAPYQVSVNTIFADKNPNVNEKAKEIAKKLEKKYRVDLDISSSNYGFKITEKEVMGVPFSVFFGPKDLDNNTCQIYRRDTGEKINISLDELTAKIESFRREYYNNLFSHAKKHLDESIVEVNNAEELKNALTSGKIGLAY
jgi:prolyl-tRNA synthetase